MHENEGKSQKIKIIGLSSLVVLLVGVAVATFIATRPTQKDLTVTENNGANASLVATGCQLSSTLVNSCRPWIGATSAGYPGVSGWEASILNFEQRAGRMADVVHSYHSPTQTALNSSELKFLNRGSQLFMNWKPDAVWANAGGKDAAVNTRIDQMATSIKSLGAKKIFLTIYHEPENDISKGGSTCTQSVGDKGTTAEYRAMWKNVRDRFNAQGVNNVVWTMNYMGYVGWDCAVKDLWPGNDLVDWLTWDPYTNDKIDFLKDMSRFYTFLTENTDATHAFTSKPWGISEMGYEGTDQKKAYKYYDDMATAITANRLPRLKMYMFFDMSGKDFGGPATFDARIGYAHATADKTEQQHFNSMFAKVAALNKPVAAADTTAPKITVTTPKNNATVSGKVTFKATATDDQKVSSVTLRVDGVWQSTDQAAPYAPQLDTKKLKNGKHTVILRAWDASQNRTDAKQVVVNVKN